VNGRNITELDIVRAVAARVFDTILCMEALAMPEVRDRLREAVDALVGESIDSFSTQALGEDIVDIHRAVDRLEAELVRRVHRFHAEAAPRPTAGGAPSPGCAGPAG
jgi:hypothetical protein